MLAEIEKPGSLIEALQEENKALRHDFEVLRSECVTMHDKLHAQESTKTTTSSYERELQELRLAISSLGNCLFTRFHNDKLAEPSRNSISYSNFSNIGFLCDSLGEKLKPFFSIRDDKNTFLAVTFPILKLTEYIELEIENLWVTKKKEQLTNSLAKKYGLTKVYFPQKEMEYRHIFQSHFQCFSESSTECVDFGLNDILKLPKLKVRLRTETLFHYYDNVCNNLFDKNEFHETDDFRPDDFLLKISTPFEGEITHEYLTPSRGKFEIFNLIIRVKKTKMKTVQKKQFWENDPTVLVGKHILIGAKNEEGNEIQFDHEGVVISYNENNQKHSILSKTGFQKFFNLKFTIHSFGIKEPVEEDQDKNNFFFDWWFVDRYDLNYDDDDPVDYDWIMPSEYMMYEEEDETTTSETAC